MGRGYKSKAERQAYKDGRRDQYNKEHPVLRWGVQSTHYRFNSDGSLDGKYNLISDNSKYTSKKGAVDTLKSCRNAEKFQKKRVLEAVKQKNVNVYNSADCTYTDYSLVKIKPERRK